MVTLQQLNCFLSVAKNLSFARASEELYISQPAVSHHIKMLEKELQTTLFIRNKHRVMLTEAGERFFVEISDVKNQLEMAVETIKNTDELPEVLRIGFENIIEIRKLPEIFAKYSKVKPNVRIYCHSVELAEGIKRFNDNKLDVLFTTMESFQSSDELFTPLFEGNFCVVMRKDDPLAKRKLIVSEDLDGRTMIFVENRNCTPLMAQIQRNLHLQYPKIKVHFSTTSYYTMPMVQAGVGIVLLPDIFFTHRSFFSKELVAIPFDTDQNVRFGIMSHKDYIADKVTQFVDITRRQYSGETGCFV